MKIILIAVSIFLFSCESVNIEKVSLEGIWGNEKDNSELVITKDRAKFDFTCSSAEITQLIPSEFENPLYIDGTFFNNSVINQIILMLPITPSQWYLDFQFSVTN